MEGLKAQSWARDFLDETVIYYPADDCLYSSRGLLNDIVQISLAQDFNPLFGPRELQADIYSLKTC